jgi:outer membrane protein assembly factor BamB
VINVMPPTTFINQGPARIAAATPVLAFVAGALLLAFWWAHEPESRVKIRLPDIDRASGGSGGAKLNPAAAGILVAGPGISGESQGAWPQFRGPDRSGVSSETSPLARVWEGGGPRELWAVDCGEGYAGASVQRGRVYLLDYEAARKQSVLRCLSVADGREIWRYEYPLPLKRNHGVTRTVPTLTDKFVVAMDSMCNVFCLDAASGRLQWGANLVREYGATVPPWYAGQCPLVEGQTVILAPGGAEALLLAVDLTTGKPLWRTPNPHGWKMTHSSVAPMVFNGRRSYVYCASGGVAGVAAATGALEWETTAWKISIANVPAPLVLDDGKIFLCGGYNAGSLMLRLKAEEGKITPVIEFRLAPEVFGATQHTPILHGGHIYGVRPNGQFVCLDPDGHVRWTSPADSQFGLGSFLLADGVFYVLNDTGRLTLVEATSERYHQLAQAQILHGIESWAPMALVNGRLFARDFTRLACLDVADK